MTAAPTPEERRRIFAGCCEHSDLWHDGHGCLCCDCKAARTAGNRWIETPDGLTKCPRCEQKARTA